MTTNQSLTSIVNNKMTSLSQYMTYLWLILKSIPTRYLFGTVTRFWVVNFLPSMRYLKTSKAKANQASELWTKGFIKPSLQLPTDFWIKLKENYSSAIEDDTKSFLTANQKTRRIKNPVDSLGRDLIFQILEDASLKNLLVDYYGGEFSLFEVNAWRNFPADMSQYVYSNFWHMDDYSFTSLRVFCYLSEDITQNSGATRIVSIPETKKAIRQFKFIHTSIDGAQEKGGKFPYIHLNGTLGDVFVFSADRCLHAATAILNNKPRDMLELVVDLKSSSSRKTINLNAAQ
jgi:hypothetical protein